MLKTKKTKLSILKDLKGVQEQYIDYPYPARNPEDEKVRLRTLEGAYLGELNHWLYAGKESFKNNFRILVAGGGTGDDVIYFGEQLKNTNAEIVYLDFSKTSMVIAQERAAIRKLKNIIWINDSILNIPNLKLGLFDYINCIGVLHHLESPDLGLQILKDSLNPKGGMTLMVYGQYGRTGVYHIQELMRIVNKNTTSRAEELKNAWVVVKSLPESNWFIRWKELSKSILNENNDIEMYDLFLHKQDRAYTIPQLYNFINKSGLNFVNFTDNSSRLLLRLENFITDSELLTELKKRDNIEQKAMCEIMSGNLIKHSFFVSNHKFSIALFDDLDNVPYLIRGLTKQIHDCLEENHNYISYNSSINIPLNLNLTGETRIVNISLPTTNFTKSLFKYMITENMSFREIFDAIILESGEKIEDKVLIEDVKSTLTILQESGILLLRNKNVEPFDLLM